MDVVVFYGCMYFVFQLFASTHKKCENKIVFLSVYYIISKKLGCLKIKVFILD